MTPFWMQRQLRRPWQGIAALLAGLLLCGMLGGLLNARRSLEEQIEAVYNSAEIACVVTDRKGTRSASLRIGAGGIAAVTHADSPLTPFVRDLRMTKEFEWNCPATGGGTTRLVGVTGERCETALDPAFGGAVRSERDDFYRSDALVCLVSERVFRNLGADRIIAGVAKDPSADLGPDRTRGVGMVELTVVGSYAGADSAVYIPFAAAMRLCDKLMGARSCDSIAFTATDTRALDQLREAAGAYFGDVDPLAGENAFPRFALTVYDESFSATVAALRQNLRRTTYLLPPAVLLCLGAGILAGWLMTKGEKNAYALMRTLGMPKRGLLLAILSEQLPPPLIGAVAAAAVLNNPLAGLLGFGLYALGCFCASLRAMTISPTQLLREQE